MPRHQFAVAVLCQEAIFPVPPPHLLSGARRMHVLGILAKELDQVLLWQLTNGAQLGLLGGLRDDWQIELLKQWLNALGIPPRVTRARVGGAASVAPEAYRE